jgi:4-amino-4-deoxy-L-arabinose transferase-like glycosyltransferase|uniref:Glycosyltransferase family 39 protein n=1 Tax=Desulfobacca acetoxidans TaxID=60893 RepID=A0A7C3SLB2_9BACT
MTIPDKSGRLNRFLDLVRKKFSFSRGGFFTSDPSWGSPASAGTPDWLYVLGLTLTGAALFFYHLGAPGLMDPDEGRYAEIAREMLLLKDWVTPQLNFLPYLEKPPLVYWLTALSFQAFGLTEGAARLPAAASALAGVLLLYFLGKTLWNPQTGFRSALILATSGGYVILGRLIILDMPLTLFLSLGIVLGYLAYIREQRPLLFWAYLALALALLIKGPVALMLAALVWGIWTLLDRRHPLTFWLHPLGLAILALLALPWFVLMSMKYPGFLRFFLGEQHVGRYVAGSIHKNPFYYYVPVLFGLMLPWGWLLPWSLGRLRQAGARGHRLFLLIWAGVILLFFTISGGKLAPYILPALPPLALLLGEGLASLADSEGRSPGFTISLLIWALSGTVLVAAYIWPPASLAPRLDKAALLQPYLLTYLVIFALAPSLAWLWRKPAWLFVGALLLGLLVSPGMERLGRTRSPREIGLTLRSQWRPGAALVGVRLYSQGLSFYARQPFHLWEFPTELDFGRKLRPDCGFFFSTPAEMTAFAASRPMVFFFLKKQNYPGLKEGLPGKFEPLADWKDCILAAYTGK